MQSISDVAQLHGVHAVLGMYAGDDVAGGDMLMIQHGQQAAEGKQEGDHKKNSQHTNASLSSIMQDNVERNLVGLSFPFAWVL